MTTTHYYQKAQLRLDRRGPPHPPSPSHHPSRCEGDAKAEGAHPICRDTVPFQHSPTVRHFEDAHAQ